MAESRKPVVYHIPVCPFSQRLEILLALKGLGDAVRFHVVDITVPRPGWLLERTRGTTAMPILETAGGRIIKESLVILNYLERLFPDPPVAQRDPERAAVEEMLIAMEGGFVGAGYRLIMNRDRAMREALAGQMLQRYRDLDAFLREHSPGGPFLFGAFARAEAVFAPFFMRFWLHGYYEDWDALDDPSLERVRRWREACVGHPLAQQVTREQIVKVYYDYALGCGNGSLPPNRRVSSFALSPDWRRRPWPPRAKYDHHATDRELGLA